MADRCYDDKAPTAVTLTVVDAVGGYDSADAAVAPNYVRNLRVDGTVGASVCGVDSVVLSLTIEQTGDRLRFQDSTELVCPE